MAKKEVEQKEEKGAKSNLPAFRLVQVENNAQGESQYREVGAAWENTSKVGKTYYVVKIGNLRLLMFPK